MYRFMKLVLLLSVVPAIANHASIESSDSHPSETSLEYVFEIVRHGARAPMIDD